MSHEKLIPETVDPASNDSTATAKEPSLPPTMLAHAQAALGAQPLMRKLKQRLSMRAGREGTRLPHGIPGRTSDYFDTGATARNLARSHPVRRTQISTSDESTGGSESRS